jgi:tetratricopeptide (TPR) repeat protein
MQLLGNFQLPPPSNWQDFQNLCLDLWSRIWNDPYATIHGRDRQEQNGVDIYGKPSDKDGYEAIQCKLRSIAKNRRLSGREISDEIEKAKDFRPKIKRFIFATTSFRDNRTQAIIREYSKKNLSQGYFSVDIVFWEDILRYLSDYDELVKKYYPALIQAIGFDRVIFPHDLSITTSIESLLNEITFLKNEVQYIEIVKIIDNKVSAVKNTVFIPKDPIARYLLAKLEFLRAELNMEIGNHKHLRLAIQQFDRLSKIFEDANDNFHRVRSLQMKAVCLRIWGYHSSSIKLFRKLGDEISNITHLRNHSIIQSHNYRDLGISYYQLSNPKSEKPDIDYLTNSSCNLEKAYEILGDNYKDECKTMLAITNQKLAVTELMKGNVDHSIKLFEMSERDIPRNSIYYEIKSNLAKMQFSYIIDKNIDNDLLNHTGHLALQLGLFHQLANVKTLEKLSNGI